MAETSLRISLLLDDVRDKVSSSSEVISHESVIEGLVRNALDADSTSVTIVADFTRGYYFIQDDGTGIKGIEFADNGHLAQLHCMENCTLQNSVANFCQVLQSSIPLKALVATVASCPIYLTSPSCRLHPCIVSNPSRTDWSSIVER